MLHHIEFQSIVDMALAEDLSLGDVTTDALIDPNLRAQASIIVKRSGVLAGIEVAAFVFQRVDPSLKFDILVNDGAKVKAGDVVASLEGAVASILKAERVALNFLQRLSGIATETARYVEAVAPITPSPPSRDDYGVSTYGVRTSGAKIMETRKTTPGLRALEKYAVRIGGGHNHRKNLGDGVLIKDNHLAALHSSGAYIAEVVRRARQNTPHTLKIEIEVETVEEARQAIEAGADIILLDNMSLDGMRQAVELARGRALTEASGGITLDNVRAVAETGVDFISIGALTHSPKALDISLELEPR